MPTVGPYLWVALTSLPGDNPYLYTDLTPWVRDDAGVGYATRRGRQQVTQKFNTGRGTYMLDNRDRRFEALNTAGPYYGNLVPMRAVQSGIEYPWLPGIIPNSDLRTSSTTSGWTNVAGAGFIAYSAPTSKQGYGLLTMTNTNGASGHQDVKGPTFPIAAAKVGGPISFSVRASNVGGGGTAVGCRVQLLCYSDAAGTVLVGTLLGGAQDIQTNQLVSLRGTGTIPASTVCARMLVTIATPVTAVALAFNCLVADYTSLSIHAENYTGYSDSWNCQWDVGDNVCTLSCSDAFKTLGLSPLSTPLYGAYLATLNATKWYRLDETVNSQHEVLGLNFKDQITGKFDAGVWTASTDQVASGYRGAGPLAGVAGASPVDNDLAFSMVGPSSSDSGAIALPKTFMPTSPTGFSVAFWYRSTNGTLPQDINQTLGTVPVFDPQLLTLWPRADQLLSGDIYLWIQLSGVNGHIGVIFNDFGLNHGVYTPTDGNNHPLPNNQNVVSDQLWHRIVFTYNKGTNAGLLYIDGLLKQTLTIAFNGNSGTGLTGVQSNAAHNVAGWPWYFGKDKNKSGGTEFWEMDELMLWDGTVLSAGTIQTDYLKSQVVYPIQTSMARASAVLDNVAWPAALRNINTSLGVQVTDLRRPFYQANPLQYLQQVEDTEVGMLFTDKQGRITFIDVNTIETATSVYSTPQAIFGNGAGEIPYENIVTRNEDSTLYTRSTATREKGAVQTYDSNNEAFYLLRTIDKNGLLLDSDEKAYNVAQFNGALFDHPGTKLQSITFNPYANEATLSLFTALELGMAITVRLRPPGITPGTYYEVLCSIQSMNTDISRGKCRCTIDVSDIYTKRWMQFGDNFSTYPMGI